MFHIIQHLKTTSREKPPVTMRIKSTAQLIMEDQVFQTASEGIHTIKTHIVVNQPIHMISSREKIFSVQENKLAIAFV
jgi:hypothetical protein